MKQKRKNNLHSFIAKVLTRTLKREEIKVSDSLHHKKGKSTLPSPLKRRKEKGLWSIVQKITNKIISLFAEPN